MFSFHVAQEKKHFGISSEYSRMRAIAILVK